MNWDKTLKKHFNKRKSIILKAIESAKRARDQAPSAMESHSDTTRNQNEKMIEALLGELNLLNSFLKRTPEKQNQNKLNVEEWTYVKAGLGKNVIELCIVPDGFGGQVVEGTRLISIETPLGKVLMNKEENDLFIFNNQEGKVLKISKF
jgi:transcription elongation GreA/GreB family factor